MQGDGLTMGGLIVLKKGGEVVYTYGEKTFGDHAPESDVSAAMQGRHVLCLEHAQPRLTLAKANGNQVSSKAP